MKVKEIAAMIEKMVSPKLAQQWDNVGLLVGDGGCEVKNVLLAIDVTRGVVAEAKKLKAELIISYHPVIWDGLKKVTADGADSVVYELIRAGVSVYSIHTALDAAVGGVNDGLAEIVGIRGAEPIGDYVADPAGDNYKLVVFVPVEATAKVSRAIFAAGGGAIGNYSNCGFGNEGIGTFLPLEEAKPAIGRKGRLEKVEEIRFETIVPGEKIADVVNAMRQVHPYETPAFDVIKLYDVESRFGLGRMGRLEPARPVGNIIEKLKKYAGARAVGLVGKEKRMVRKAAVCAGSCGKIINLVIAAGCDLYVTGELKHHQALAAQEAGLTCICLSHSVSERFILKKFSRQLQKQLKEVTIRVSRKDSDPFKWKNI